MGIDFELLHKVKVIQSYLLVLTNKLWEHLMYIESSYSFGMFLWQGVMECPCPDKDIRRFDANLRLFPPFLDNDVCPLTIKNTILQSCYLRNTEWACGVAVYTGIFISYYNHIILSKR